MKKENEARKAEKRQRYILERKWERLMKKTKYINPYFNSDTQQVMWGTNRQDFHTDGQNY